MAVKKGYSPQKSPRKASKKGLKKSKVRYPIRQCIVCDKKVRRLDVHAVKVHQSKRGSDIYHQILQDSPLVQGMEAGQGQTVNIQAGHVIVTANDKIKEFLDEYKKYLRNRTALGDQVVTQAVRCVGEVLRAENGEDPCTTLTGVLVCRTFDKMAQVTPPGFLESRKEMYSANYKRRIVLSCKRAVDFMFQSTSQFSIDRTLKMDISARLEEISGEKGFSMLWAISAFVMHGFTVSVIVRISSLSKLREGRKKTENRIKTQEGTFKRPARGL